MKYLNPEPFTIAVTDRHITREGKLFDEIVPKPAPRWNHEYIPYGAVCFECGLDRVGHTLRYEQLEEGA